MTTPFDLTGGYYDLLYADKDYAGEARYVAGQLPADCRAILELGSGSGIHAALLAEAGHDVTGVERSPAMLARACDRAVRTSESAGPLEFHSGDARTVRLGRQFDAVISLFHVVSYQTTDDDAAAIFATATEHLRPGGLFLFDIWYGPAVLSQQPAVRVKRMQNEQIAVTRTAEPMLHPNANVVDVHYEIFATDLATGRIERIEEDHSMRYFFLPELAAFGRAAGLVLEHAEEWMTGREPSADTWGVCLAMRKAG
jgi:SAM-dependent methyltransferase